MRKTRSEVSLWKVAHAFRPRLCSPNTCFCFQTWTTKSKKKRPRGLQKPSKKQRKRSPNWCQNLPKSGPHKKGGTNGENCPKSTEMVPEGRPKSAQTARKIHQNGFFLDRGAWGTPGPPKGRPGSTWPAKLCPKSPNGSPKVSTKAPKWSPKTTQMNPKPTTKTLHKLLENRRAFCPSDDWNKKRATRDPTYIISDIYYSIDIRVARVRARSRARARARVRTWVWEPV